MNLKINKTFILLINIYKINNNINNIITNEFTTN